MDRFANENNAENSNTNVKKQKSLDLLKTNFKGTLDENKDKIQHTKVEISKAAKFRDIAKKAFGLEASKRTPKRVNEQVNQFKANLDKIRKKSDSLDHFPNEQQRSQFVKVATSLVDQFQPALENAVDDYNSSNLWSRSRKHQKRHDAQDLLEKLNTQLNNMVQALDGWRYMRYMMTAEDTHIQSLSDNLEGSEIEIVGDQLNKAEKEYQKVLNQYQEDHAQPDEWKSFKDILDWFKKPREGQEKQITAANLKTYAEEFFKNQFIFHLIERDIDPADLPLAINRKMTPREVGQKHKENKDIVRAFSIAKGKAIEEIGKLTSCDHNTKKFTDRYYIDKEADNISIRVQGCEYSIYPYIYNIKRHKKQFEVLSIMKYQDSMPVEDTAPLSNSEIIYDVLLLKKFLNFKQIVHRSVSNQDTQYIYELFQDDPYSHTDTLKKGGDEYYAILGTQNGFGTFFLLEQHKEFGRATLSGGRRSH